MPHASQLEIMKYAVLLQPSYVESVGQLPLSDSRERNTRAREKLRS